MSEIKWPEGYPAALIFEVGDRVLCVDTRMHDETKIKKGVTYTVAYLTPPVFDGIVPYLHLENVEGGWHPERFRKIN